MADEPKANIVYTDPRVDYDDHPPLPIETEMQHIETGLSRLESALGELHRRLAPITSAAEPPSVAREPEPKVILSDHAARLSGYQRIVHQLADEINVLLMKIEL